MGSKCNCWLYWILIGLLAPTLAFSTETISGTVMGNDGYPVSKAILTGPGFLDGIGCDEQGRFQVPHPDGSTLVLIIKAPGYKPISRYIDLPLEGPLTIELTRLESLKLRVMSKGESSQLLPAQRIRVAAFPQPWDPLDFSADVGEGFFQGDFESTGDGWFELHDFEPGVYDLGIGSPGAVPIMIRGIQVGGDTSPLRVVTLEPGRVLEGRVIWKETGEPAAGVSVLNFGESQVEMIEKMMTLQMDPGVTDEQGRFRVFAMPMEGGHILVDSRNQFTGVLSVNTLPIQDGCLLVALDRGATLSGNFQGLPHQFDGTLICLQGEHPFDYIQPFPFGTLCSWSDDGAYMFAGIPGGTYTWTAHTEAGTLTGSEEISVVAGQSLQMDLVWPKE